MAPRPLRAQWRLDWGEVKAFVGTKPKQQVLCNYNNKNNNKGNTKVELKESELQRKRRKEAYLLVSLIKMDS